MDRQSVQGAINKVSKDMQEATKEKRARFPDLRDLLDDIGVQTGANATTAAVDAAVDWLDLEGQQGISDAVERDRQDIALEHIHETAGDSTYDSEDDGDHEENEWDCGSPEELQRCMDCLDEFATVTDNLVVSHHVREIREEVARTFSVGKGAEMKRRVCFTKTLGEVCADRERPRSIPIREACEETPVAGWLETGFAASSMDRNVLVRFREEARGSSWPAELQWDIDSDPASWHGVEVDTEGRVIELVLEGARVEGSTSTGSPASSGEYGRNEGSDPDSIEGDPEDTMASDDSDDDDVLPVGDEDAGFITSGIGDLSTVVTLRIAHMGLGGVIPVEVEKLEQLVVLDLRGNMIRGTVPAAVSELGNLEELLLGKNRLRGPIPTSLGKLKKLLTLDLSHNMIQGEIPEETGELEQLTTLDVSYNLLRGAIPSSLGRLEQLLNLDLSHNKLQGDIPSELGKLVKLKKLNLRHNRLTGVIPAELGRQRQLEILDLGYNMLEGVIPEELGDLTSLVTIDLSYIKIQGRIPSSFGKLRMLRRLTIRATMIKGTIPAALGCLQHLEVLNLTANRLEGPIPPGLGRLEKLRHMSLRINSIEGRIPASLGRLQRLLTLDLGYNRLEGTIPAELGKLKHLRRLVLTKNRLEGVIPQELSNLKDMEDFHVTRNRLTGLWDYTEDIGKQDSHPSTGNRLSGKLEALLEWLKGLESRNSKVECDPFFGGFARRVKPLQLVSNPFREPPAAVVEKGVKAVESYLRDRLANGVTVEHQQLKAVIVGQQGAGKTSLLRSLRDHEPSRTRGSEDSTVDVDVERVQLQNATVRIFDCAGQLACHGLAPMFITRRTLCLIVCDASKFGARRSRLTDEEQLEIDIEELEALEVCHWLRVLSWRVPGCNVLLVGTKCDLLPPESIEDVEERIEAACRTWTERWELQGMNINVEPGVVLTSCVTPSEGEAASGDNSASLSASSAEMKMSSRAHEKPMPTVSEGRNWPSDFSESPDSGSAGLLHRITHTVDGMSRAARMTTPRGWDLALTVLDALSAGRDPIASARRWLFRAGDTKESDNATTYSVITMKELSRKWRRVVEELKSTCGYALPQEKHALEGALSIREEEGQLLRHGSYVFLDVGRLTAALRPLVYHKEIVEADGTIVLGMIGKNVISLTTTKQQDAWARLKQHGIMDIKLARVLWPNGLSEFVLETLISMGLTFPLFGKYGGEVVLTRLPMDRPASVSEDLESIRAVNYPALCLKWKAPLGVAPGVVEKMLARCCSLGSTTTFWRFGVVVEGDLSGEIEGRFAILMEYSHRDHTLVMEAYGDVLSVGPWAAVSYAVSVMLSVVEEFPGLPWLASLCCPTHSKGDFGVSREACEPGDKILTGRGCDGCNPHTRELGAFALELLRVIDVKQSRDAVLQEVKTRFVSLRRDFPAARPKSPAGENKLLKLLIELIEDTKNCLKNPVHRGPPRKQADFVTYGADKGGDRSAQPWAEELEELDDMLTSLAATGEAFQLRDSKQQHLLEMVKAIQKQGEEAQALIDFVETLMEVTWAFEFGTPRLACVLPPWDFECKRGLSSIEQDPLQWKSRLNTRAFTADEERFTREMRLFLVCADSYRLVPSGPNGQGYPIAWAPRWVEKMARPVNLMLEITCAALGAMVDAGLALSYVQVTTARASPVKRRETVAEVKARLESLIVDDDASVIGRTRELSRQQTAEDLDREAHAALWEFTREVEIGAHSEEVKAARRARRRGQEPPKASFVFFKDVMEEVQARDSNIFAQWVLRD